MTIGETNLLRNEKLFIKCEMQNLKVFKEGLKKFNGSALFKYILILPQPHFKEKFS